MAATSERVTFGIEASPPALASDDLLEDIPRLSLTPIGTASLPIQLVRVDARGKLELCSEGLSLLASIDPPLAVIAFAGPYRSGKSFALNLMLEMGQAGFKVGNSVKACTQGIWIWGNPIKRKGITYLLVDSEGSGSTTASPDRDGKLFALVILLSSLFVFNTMGVIDEHAINQLSLAAYMYEQLQPEDSSDSQSLQARLLAFCPRFIWLLRDFHLSLVDRQNQPLSAKDYMDNILTSEAVKGRNIDNFQKARDVLLNLFVDRDCFVVPRPADSEADLNRLEELKREQLRPRFVEAFDRFRVAAFETCPVKKFRDKEISGRHLAEMLRRILDAINRGVLPNLESGWENILMGEYEEMLKQMKITYLKRRNVELEHMPYEESVLVLNLHRAKDAALSILTSSPLHDPRLEQETQDEFEGFFEDDVKYSIGANQTASEAFNLALLKNLFAPIIEKLNADEYRQEMDRFEVEWGRALKRYEEEARGPGKLTAINNFIIENQNTAISGYFQGIIEALNEEISKLKNSSVENNSRLAMLKDQIKSQEDSERRFAEQISRIEKQLELDNHDKTLGIRLKEILDKLSKPEMPAPVPVQAPVTSSPPPASPTALPRKQPAQQNSCCALS